MSVGNLYPLAEARGKWTSIGRPLRPFLAAPALSPGASDSLGGAESRAAADRRAARGRGTAGS